MGWRIEARWASGREPGGQKWLGVEKCVQGAAETGALQRADKPPGTSFPQQGFSGIYMHREKITH